MSRELLATDVLRNLDDYVSDFETACARGRAELCDFLPENDDPLYRSVLVELIRVEMEILASKGVAIRVDAYLNQFAELNDHPKLICELAVEEFRQRRAMGESPDPSEYRKRFGVILPLAASKPQPAIPANAVPMWAGADFPQPGETVPPGYLLMSELGRGAFGRVYLARQSDLADRPVAIKISSRLLGEAETLARLQHTNIVPIHSAHRVGRFQLVAMPFFGQQTLDDLMRSIGDRDPIARMAATHVEPGTAPDDSRLPEPIGTPHATPGASVTKRPIPTESERLRMVLSIAEGLAHAHHRGIVHRDLKPANILLADDDGRPLILDFNLAIDAGQSSDLSAGGTLRYMAPEQIEQLLDPSKKAVDHRADIYALGLILHELLTGEIPFETPTGPWREAARKALEFRKHIGLVALPSPAMSAILNRCLSPDPSDRYASANLLAEDLRAQMNDQPLRIAGEPYSRERVRKWLRRHPRIASSTSVALIFSIGLITLALIANGIAERNRESRQKLALHDLPEVRDRLQPVVAAMNVSDRRLLAAIGEADAILRQHQFHPAPKWLQGSGAKIPEESLEVLRQAATDLYLITAEARGHLATRAGDTEKAGRLEDALNRNAMARSVRGESFRSLELQRAWLLELSGRPDEARLIRSSLPYETSTRDSIALAIAADFRSKDYSSAMKRLGELVPESSRSYSLLMMSGECRLRLRQFDQAADDFLMASALEPAETLPLYQRGLALIEAGRYPAAKLAWDRLIGLQPEDALSWIHRGIVDFHLGQIKEAVRDLDRAESLGAEHPKLYSLRSRCYVSLNQIDAGAEDLQTLLKIRPSDTDGWCVRGEAKLAAEPPDASGALADFEEALRLEPRFVAALRGKASCLSEHLRRPDDAIEVIRAVLETDRGGTEEAGLAVLLVRLGKVDEGLAMAGKVLRRATEPLAIYQAASALALRASTPVERRRVIRELRRVLRLDPSWVKAMKTDDDLTRIRMEPEFTMMLQAATTLIGSETAQ
jgi:eukaryotic-like serine/threonine-protein kinase